MGECLWLVGGDARCFWAAQQLRRSGYEVLTFGVPELPDAPLPEPLSLAVEELSPVPEELSPPIPQEAEYIATNITKNNAIATVTAFLKKNKPFPCFILKKPPSFITDNQRIIAKTLFKE